jgi:FtsH-binding integral membrane protein
MNVFLENAKEFFSAENFKFLLLKIYEWFEITLKTLFGKIPYAPIRELFTNPWFWIIIVAILILCLIFRRR